MIVDRALAGGRVEVGEAAPVRAGAVAGVDRDAVVDELGVHGLGDRVVAERGEEGRRAREAPRSCTAATAPPPPAAVNHSRPWTTWPARGQAVDDAELDVLDVADDADRRRHAGGAGRTSAEPFWRSQRRGSR